MIRQPTVYLLLLSVFGMYTGKATTSSINLAFEGSIVEDKISNVSIQYVTSSKSKISCAKKCMVAGNCKAFFYNKKTKKCQLHSCDLYNFNLTFATHAPGYQFYRIKRDEEDVLLPVDCYDILKQGYVESGMYIVYPSGLPEKAYCDQETDCGGWLVFQRRKDGSENFYRDWNDYRKGFGHVNDEFWRGNDFLAELTSKRNYSLRVDLESFEGETRFAIYDHFKIGDSSTNYALYTDHYQGTAGNSMGGHNGSEFSTFDRDNDISPNGNCAVWFNGAWWFKNCHNSNLNGLYLGGNHTSYANGVNWEHWKGFYYSLKFTEMKLRPTTN